MATAAQDASVRDYLIALKNPAALLDDSKLSKLQDQLTSASDELERVRLQQQIIEAREPSIDRYEESFVTHAKAWADDHGISSQAFLAEGVPSAVLRKAGFRGVPGGGRGRPRATGTRRTRSRVSAEAIRGAMPRGQFTVKQLQDASGASPGAVRKVVTEDVQGGRLNERGPDPDHTGPGRAPTLYQRS